VGTYDGGGEKAASYLHFNEVMSLLEGTTILSASLRLWTYHSYSCNPAPVKLHAVTQSWYGPSTTSWPGPAYEATPLSEASWAYGYSSCPNGGWGVLPIPASRMTDWVNGAQPFYGFALRASETASSGWKRFRAKSYDGNTSQRPYVEVTYVAGVAGISAISPAPHGTVNSLTPTVWADLVDPANTGIRKYEYKVCLGDDPDAPGPCAHSGAAWLTNPTWQVPAGDAVKWGQPSHWYAQVSNGLTSSGWQGPYFFDTVLAQPPVTSHLAGAPEGADLPGVNPQVGNYATTVTDAQVAVAGPALRVTRTYNSQDPRVDGAFGPGWATPLDQRLVTETDEDGDSAGYVVVTLASGREVRFGRNNDGSYTPPPGMNLTLTASPPGWTLRDTSATQTIFDSAGKLTQIRDVDGRSQHYTWTGSQLTKVTDTASGRSLHLTWTNGRVTQVATDVPAAGLSAPTWTYTYTSGKLTGVCTPLGASACTTYGYGSGSHYRSVVLDDNPAGYWPLGETSGTTARNVAARKANEWALIPRSLVVPKNMTAPVSLQTSVSRRGES
jgi:YD repeat-containing protein